MRKTEHANIKGKPVVQYDSTMLKTGIECDLALTGWKNDLVNTGFHVEKQFFGSLLGISYYLSKDEFRNFLMEILSILKSI